jgi:hypothetical protein
MSKDDNSTTETDGSDDERVEETDEDRRKAMLDASQASDLDNFKYDFPHDIDFNLPAPEDSDIPTSGSTSPRSSSSKGKDRAAYPNEGM